MPPNLKQLTDELRAAAWSPNGIDAAEFESWLTLPRYRWSFPEPATRLLIADIKREVDQAPLSVRDFLRFALTTTREERRSVDDLLREFAVEHFLGYETVRKSLAQQAFGELAFQLYGLASVGPESNPMIETVEIELSEATEVPGRTITDYRFELLAGGRGPVIWTWRWRPRPGERLESYGLGAAFDSRWIGDAAINRLRPEGDRLVAFYLGSDMPVQQVSVDFTVLGQVDPKTRADPSLAHLAFSHHGSYVYIGTEHSVTFKPHRFDQVHLDGWEADLPPGVPPEKATPEVEIGPTPRVQFPALPAGSLVRAIWI